MNECKHPREFCNIMWARIKPYGWRWKRDVRPWLSQKIGPVKFGDPAFDWSQEAADQLAKEFLNEASTW